MSLYKDSELVSINPNLSSVIINEDIHCKIGSDTWGLFANIYNLHFEGISDESLKANYYFNCVRAKSFMTFSVINTMELSLALAGKNIPGCIDSYAETITPMQLLMMGVVRLSKMEIFS